MDDALFRDLDPQERAEFEQWARDNYKVGDRISPLWHPVTRAECRLMNDEAKENDARTQDRAAQ